LKVAKSWLRRLAFLSLELKESLGWSIPLIGYWTLSEVFHWSRLQFKPIEKKFRASFLLVTSRKMNFLIVIYLRSIIIIHHKLCRESFMSRGECLLTPIFILYIIQIFGLTADLTILPEKWAFSQYLLCHEGNVC